MKKSVSVSLGFIMFLFACDTGNKQNDIAVVRFNRYHDSIDSVNHVLEVAKQNSAPLGFYGIGWYATKQEAVKYLKSKDSIKIIRVIDFTKKIAPYLEAIIYATGFFAGLRVKSITFTFYLDKFCKGVVNFGHPSGNTDQIITNLEAKYGKSEYDSQFHDHTWDFGNTDKNNSRVLYQIRFYPDTEGDLLLEYKAVNTDYYEGQVMDIDQKNAAKRIKASNF